MQVINYFKLLLILWNKILKNIQVNTNVMITLLINNVNMKTRTLKTWVRNDKLDQSKLIS